MTRVSSEVSDITGLLYSFMGIFVVIYKSHGSNLLHADWEDNKQIGRMPKVLLHRLTHKSIRRIATAVDHILNQASAPFALIA